MTTAERKELALRLFGTGEKGKPGPIDSGWITAKLMKRNRMTLKRWRENGIPADRLEEVIETLRAILPGTEKEAAPSMTGRLVAGVIALERKAGVTPAELAAAQAEAATLEAAAEVDARLVAELEASQRKPSEQEQGRAGGQSGGSPSSKRQKRR